MVHPRVLPLLLVGCLTPVDFGSESLIGWAEPEDAVATVAETLTPFDVNLYDQAGPARSTYGKTPEIVVASEHHDLYVFAHDYGENFSGSTPPIGAKILKLRRTETDYILTQVIEPPGFIDRILGFDRDRRDGSLYIASAAAESDRVNAEYPAENEYREGVVHVSRLDSQGVEVFRTDLDVARAAVADHPEQVINPMVAATGRLAVGGGTIAVVHGINTTPDPNIDNRRHQKALTTFINAETGDVSRLSSIWVSHSFDQRLQWDGEAFVEHHLGDAYPRHIAFARTDPTDDSGVPEVPLLFIKGESGENTTRTSIGAVVSLPDDDSASFLAVYVTEPTETTEPINGDFSNVSGSRELAVTRVMEGFATLVSSEQSPLDAELPDRLDVPLGETRLRWLTNYQAESSGLTHAERPRLMDVGEGRYVVLWEKWDLSSGRETYDGTWGMVIDAKGETLVEGRKIVRTHLPRGDDLARLPGQAAWVTGDSVARSLVVHTVDGELEYRAFTVK
ncbi:MAG: hypothetical protein AB8H79_20120 [Myxococcota bacterium]